VEQIYDEGDNVNWGLFLRSGQKQTNCDGDTSTMACGYLSAAQASGVIFVVLGLWTTMIYIPRVYQNVPMNQSRILAAGVSSLMQTLFGIMCLVFFDLWVSNTLQQPDRTNIEYDSEKFHSTMAGSYWVFMVLTIASGFLSTIAFLMHRTVVEMNKI